MHHRLSPKRHRFEYGIFMALLDLDELDAFTARLRLFGRNRFRPYNFRDDDHLRMRGSVAGRQGETSGLKSEIRSWLAEQGVSTGSDCRISLLTLPRVLGYVFNPVSFYFVETAAGEPVCAIAEVGNTFGELKPYLVPLDAPPPDGGPHSALHAPHPAFRRVAAKHFYVSPFSDLELNFDFRLHKPGARLQIGVNDVTGAGETVLVSTLTGQRRPLTDGQLLRLTLRYPLVTLHIIGLIHWHALKLWWKRIPWHRKSAKAELQQGVFRPHGPLKQTAPRPINPASVPAQAHP